MPNNVTLELKIVERIKSDYIDINIIHLNIKQYFNVIVVVICQK